MLRRIIFCVWVCAIFLVSLLTIQWLSVDSGKPRTIEEKGEVLKLDSISVPVISDAQVTGYVIAQLAFLIDSEKAKLLPMPLEVLVSGETFAFLYDHRGRDALKRNASVLGKAMEELRGTINSRYTIEVVKAIEVKQLDFLSKEEIRDRQIRKAAN